MATAGTVTLQDWRKKLARQVGLDQDTIIPRNKEALDQYIQDALRDVYSYQRWEFMEEYYRVRLYAAESEGTVAVTSGDTAWTGTGTEFSTSMSGGTIKIRAENEIYRIATIVSTTALTSTDAAIQEMTESNYVLYMDEVDLGAAVENIEACWVSLDDRRLRPMVPSVMAGHKSRGFFSGHPQYFAPKGRTSGGYLRLELYPIPAFNEILHVQAYKAGTVPTADSGTSDIPDQFQNVVLARAKMYLHEGPLGKPELYGPASQEYGRLQALMVHQACANQGPYAIPLDPAVHGKSPITHDVTKTEVV